MSILSVDAAAVTVKAKNQTVNYENYNINEKVYSKESVSSEKGKRIAAENVAVPFYCAVASSNEEDFASGAMKALNNGYTTDMADSDDEKEAVLNGYFDDLDAVIDQVNDERAKLRVGLIYVSARNIIAGRLGDCRILRYTDGGIFEVARPEEGADRGTRIIHNVKDGDVFVILGSGCSEDPDYESLQKDFENSSNVKETVVSVFNTVSKSREDKDRTIVAIKIKADDTLPASVNEESDDARRDEEAINAFEGGAAAHSAVDNDDNGEVEVESDSDEDKSDNAADKEHEKKKVNIVPIIILVILVAGVCCYFIYEHYFKNKSDNKPEPVSVSAEASTEEISLEITTEEETTEAETEEKTEESTAEETTTKKETTTHAVSTTRSSSNRNYQTTTTRRYYTTTTEAATSSTTQATTTEHSDDNTTTTKSTDTNEPTATTTSPQNE